MLLQFNGEKHTFLLQTIYHSVIPYYEYYKEYYICIFTFSEVSFYKLGDYFHTFGSSVEEDKHMSNIYQVVVRWQNYSENPIKLQTTKPFVINGFMNINSCGGAVYLYGTIETMTVLNLVQSLGYTFEVRLSSFY